MRKGEAPVDRSAFHSASSRRAAQNRFREISTDWMDPLFRSIIDASLFTLITVVRFATKNDIDDLKIQSFTDCI